VKYDPRFPIAVFIGPSLPLAEARAILPAANYYPPVRMGDVYRLLGSGVRRILVIDGIFHSATPVWQRELLAAMDMGIEVLGASSMGALRAAELRAFGMIGIGVIFEWYRDGVIDADDEVALMHGDEVSGYRALSEPLVNIRATLSAARDAGVIHEAAADALLARARETFYADRNYPRLLGECDSAVAERLADFVRERAVNLKADDARTALRVAAERPPPPARSSLPLRSGPLGDPFYHTTSSMLRGIPDGQGGLHAASFLVAGRLAGKPDLGAELTREFFLALASAGLECPEAFFRQFRDDWAEAHGQGGRSGLTELERDTALRGLAALAWATGGVCEREDDLLRAWASRQGIAAPAGEELVEWMIAKTPAWFGYPYWNAAATLLLRLQMRNETAAMPC
jgi:hypothetical protein